MDTAGGVSLSACSEPYHGTAEAKRSGAKAQPVVVFARCERGPDGAAPEKPGVARAQSGTGVDRRRKYGIINVSGKIANFKGSADMD
jgi:hypothetical protein